MLTATKGYNESISSNQTNSTRTPRSLRTGQVVKKFRDWYMSIGYVDLKKISQLEEDISRMNRNVKVDAVITCLKAQVKSLTKDGLTPDEERVYTEACNELREDQGSHGWILENVGIYNARKRAKMKNKTV